MRRYRHLVPPGRPRPSSFVPGLYSLQPWLVVACLPLVTGLACLGSGPQTAADIRAGITHLPTLTRTPLPTLTPTGIAMAGDLSPPAQPAAAASPGVEPAALAAAPQESLPPPGSVPAAAQPGAVDPATPPQGQPPAQIDPSTGPATPVLPTLESSLTGMPTATETATPATIPTDTPVLPTPTFTPLSEPWSFQQVQAQPEPLKEKLLLHGYIVNNTGTTQELAAITATFFNDQGQVIADENTTASWPTKDVPPAGRMPFQLIAPGLTSAANWELEVAAEPVSEIPRQDFQFSDVTARAQSELYCVKGRVHNPGERLLSYLSIVAVIYDSEGKVINYSDNFYDQESMQVLADSQSAPFNVCAVSFGQDVAHYELLAYGL